MRGQHGTSRHRPPPILTRQTLSPSRLDSLPSRSHELRRSTTPRSRSLSLRAEPRHMQAFSPVPTRRPTHLIQSITRSRSSGDGARRRAPQETRSAHQDEYGASSDPMEGVLVCVAANGHMKEDTFAANEPLSQQSWKQDLLASRPSRQLTRSQRSTTAT